MADKDKRITKLDEVLSDMESKLLLVGGTGDGSTGADMKVFEIMIHKLRKEFKNRFITTEELNEKQQEIMKEIEKVRELDNDIKEQASKLDIVKKTADAAVDTKDFKYEIDKLASQIRSIGARLKNRSATDGEPQEATDDVDIGQGSLGMFEMKFTSIDESIESLREQIKGSEEKLKKELLQLKLNKYDYTTGRQLKETVDKLQNKVDDVEKSVKSCVNKMEDEIEALLIERIKPLEEDSKGHGDIILQITQRIQRMEVKIENITKTNNQQKSKNDGVDSEKLKNVENNIKTMARDIEVIKQDLTKKVEEIMKSIYFKCDKTDVNAIETKILDNLDELVQTMYNKFSDKVETKENLKILDRQIKNLFDLIVSKEKKVEVEVKNKEEDEVMLSRKPLGGISCASCSKLVNLYNQQANEYFSWSKLPLRDPTDRIARVGQGFSKQIMLKTSKDFKGHMSSTDLVKDIDVPDSPETPKDKSRNKHLSPFTVHNVAQRTARERKVKQLDKNEDDKKMNNDMLTYLPHIVRSTNDLESEGQ